MAFVLKQLMYIYKASLYYTNEILDVYISSYFFSSDHEDPIINNTPANIIQNTDSGLPTAIVTWQEPTATDNSGSQTLTSSHQPGSAFNIGITIITHTSIDSSGNIVTDSFIIDIHGK